VVANIPALDSAHTTAVLADISIQENDTVVICLSGRGDKDLQAYMKKMEHE